MPTVLRILDANANRAREALRVMEEAARFLLDDAALCEGIKVLRHDLAGVLAAVRGLEAHRDTPGDVGTGIHTEREATRESVAEVAVAAGKRLSEALRAIEEYGKTLGEAVAPVTLPSAVEQLRYRGYELERRLLQSLGCAARRQWKLCVLLTESLCTKRSWSEVLDAAIEGGADCVQVREKDMADAALLERVKLVVSRCRPRGVSVIVNDRPDLAVLASADGVHLGQDDLPCREVRKLVGRQMLIGVSTSCLEQARAASADGADYCGVGPMFATTTKRKDTLAGPAYLRQYLAEIRLPHLAIGGVAPENVGELVKAGVRGVAVSSAVCAAEQPRDVAHRLIAGLGLGLTGLGVKRE